MNEHGVPLAAVRAARADARANAAQMAASRDERRALLIELRTLMAEAESRPVLCPDWCPGGCRREQREARIEELRTILDGDDS